MDSGGGILFRGEGEAGNATSFYMDGHDVPLPNPNVTWDVSPETEWDGERYHFKVSRKLSFPALKHPIV